tara:strand:- start:1141 stop:1581 length:441 start_codon:yes stop_codon:yes gene_type:complete
MEMNNMIDNEEWITQHNLSDGPVLQVRVNAGENILHIQGYGNEHNRPYGFAHKYHVPLELTEWLRTQDPTHLSFASDIKAYIRGVVTVQYTNGVQLLIDGKGGNHTQGTHFVLDMNTKKPLVQELMDFVNNNDLLIEHNTERWVQE